MKKTQKIQKIWEVKHAWEGEDIDYSELDNDTLIEMRENCIHVLYAKHGLSTADVINELLEIERELTLREEDPY